MVGLPAARALGGMYVTLSPFDGEAPYVGLTEAVEALRDELVSV